MTAKERNSKSKVRRGPLHAMVAKKIAELGLSNVVEFAAYAGLSDTVMYDMLNGRVVKGVAIMPKWQSITKLAAALGKPTHEIMYLFDPEAPGADLVLGVQQVPVYVAGCVGAGPERLIDSDDMVYVEKAFADNRDLIAFHVCGDSMAGGKRPIYDGDIVIVDRNVEPEINSPVVARLVDDGYVVKRLRPGGILDSANQEYSDPATALIPPSRVARMVGRVVRIHSNIAVV
ncbi:S24 family peptidase [Deinococcus sp.]|uniref:S24 family peptidase n=1 Tax=Deinococcus sp. TaxID=47478 RepID=UPI0025C5261D|nr:S24 family peptidase [Deinococcus sp.]